VGQFIVERIVVATKKLAKHEKHQTHQGGATDNGLYISSSWGKNGLE